MQFTVPQFIEHEAKIIGPLTFRQSVIIGIAGAICFFLYFSIAEVSFFLFLVLSIFILGLGVALAFLKIGPQGLPTILANFLRFSLVPKIYIWRKGKIPVVIFKKVEIKKEMKEVEPPLSANEGSHLKKIKTEIEVKTK